MKKQDLKLSIVYALLITISAAFALVGTFLFIFLSCAFILLAELVSRRPRRGMASLASTVGVFLLLSAAMTTAPRSLLFRATIAVIWLFRCSLNTVGIEDLKSFQMKPNKSLQPTRGGALGLSRSRGLFYIAVPAWLSFSR